VGRAEQAVLAGDHLAGSERTRGGCAVPRAEGRAVDSDMVLVDVVHQELSSSASCFCLLQPLPPLDPRVDLVSVATCHCFWVHPVLLAKNKKKILLQTFPLDAVEVSVCAASYPFLRSREYFVLCVAT